MRLHQLVFVAPFADYPIVASPSNANNRSKRKIAILRSNPILSLHLIPGVWPDRPPGATLALTYRTSGISVTNSWATPADALNFKIELDNTIAAGLKAEVSSQFKPAKGPGAQKLSLFFKQPVFHTRAFFDLAPNGGVQAVVDGVVSHEGFVVGGEVGYDVQKAALSRYSATVGYSTPSITAALAATNNLSVFTASYYQKVNAAVEVGTKAAYDAKNSTTVGLEVASKYKIDPLSFAKAKINDRGIASIAYNTKVNPGFTLGVGASFDTQKLNEAGHKVRCRLYSKETALTEMADWCKLHLRGLSLIRLSVYNAPLPSSSILYRRDPPNPPAIILVPQTTAVQTLPSHISSLDGYYSLQSSALFRWTNTECEVRWCIPSAMAVSTPREEFAL